VFIPVYLAGLRKMGCFSGKKIPIFCFCMKSFHVLWKTRAILGVCFFLMYNGMH
jgi:hypothetical protein